MSFLLYCGIALLQIPLWTISNTLDQIRADNLTLKGNSSNHSECSSAYELNKINRHLVNINNSLEKHSCN